jgi:hypothetical protein
MKENRNKYSIIRIPYELIPAVSMESKRKRYIQDYFDFIKKTDVGLSLEYETNGEETGSES